VKLLLDQDIYEVTARFLIGLEYDVVRVRELGMAQASDEENLKKALELNHVFITRDKDYGNLVYANINTLIIDTSNKKIKRKNNK